MKLLLMLLTILCAFGFPVSAIWAIVQFILYLVKDIPFDWLSVWCIPISLILTIIFYTAYLFKCEKDKKNSLNKFLGKYARK